MPDNTSHDRRTFLRRAAAGAGTLSVAGLAGCADILGDSGTDGPLTVAVYGGVFQDVMDEHLFEPFAETVDYEVESEAQPTSEEALTQYENAVGAGEAPVDVAIMAQTGLMQGLNSDLWHVWEGEDEFENVEYVSDGLVYESGSGVAGVGALSWYINLVQNTEHTDGTIDSWEALWDDEYEDMLGLLSYASNSFLLDVTAEVYHDGQDVLSDREGVMEVFETLEGVTSQAGFWYENEAEFQNFVEEGSILDSGLWVTLDSTDLVDEAREFIDYASRPEVQDRVAENLYTSPTVERQYSELDDEMYERIAGPGPDEAIVPTYELYVDEADWVNERWEEFIVSG